MHEPLPVRWTDWMRLTGGSGSIAIRWVMVGDIATITWSATHAPLGVVTRTDRAPCSIFITGVSVLIRARIGRARPSTSRPVPPTIRSERMPCPNVVKLGGPPPACVMNR
jgi:hypothetical protein